MRHVLAELPETLDETYERILSEIPKSNRVYAHRLLQCLTVSFRPLDVEELGEVLVVDFTAIGGTPTLKEDLRWEDQEQAVLSACSSLITVVEYWDSSRVVQFSHFSVKEFLTSDRLATSKMDTSRYHHIRLLDAHATMAQACLSVMLRWDYNINRESIRHFPLAEYAARYFGEHVEFEDVLSHIRGGVDDLDGDKSHFAAWLWMREGRYSSMHPPQARAVPLYYVTQFGYLSLVDYLISKHPEDVNAIGENGTLLHAASRRGHIKIVGMLLGHFVDVDVRNANNETPLHLAAPRGSVEIARKLIERNADINAVDNKGRTPLYLAVVHGNKDGNLDIARFFLDHGADVDAWDNEGSTLLHAASYTGSVKTVELLLKHGADIHGRDKKGRTPLLHAVANSEDGWAESYFDAMLLLLEHGADANARDNDHKTAMHLARKYGCVKAARLLLEHGASVHLQDSEGETALVASARGRKKFRSF